MMALSSDTKVRCKSEMHLLLPILLQVDVSFQDC